MTYILPRAFIVLIGWGITCALIYNIWPGVDPAIFVLAGVSWVLAGFVCLGYMHRLRSEIEDQRTRF
jgi:hypothetical protein